MVCRRVAQDHGFLHGTVYVRFAGDRACGFFGCGAEMPCDAQVGEGDMPGQFFLHEPVAQAQVRHILDFVFVRLAERTYKIEEIVRPIPQCIERVQYEVVPLQRQHTAEEKDGVLSFRGSGLRDGHGTVDRRIGLQIEQMQPGRIRLELPDEVVAVAFGVADDGVGVPQGVGVQQMQKAACRSLRPENASVTAESVIERDEEIYDAVSAAQLPGEKGQDQLRGEADEHRVAVFDGGAKELEIYPQQPEKIRFAVRADDAEARGMFLQQPDLLCIPDIIQSFRCDEQDVFFFY